MDCGLILHNGLGPAHVLMAFVVAPGQAFSNSMNMNDDPTMSEKALFYYNNNNNNNNVACIAPVYQRLYVPFVCPFVRSDIVTTISHERLDREIFISPYW